MTHGLDPGALDRFKATFATLLSSSKHEAIQVFFSGLQHDTP